eukprot:GHVL01044821.1.p1 GENE.GHVL01044821.1~~GHVL01044821.1.p1  ORF type:complete len:114 (-),score=6.22 GHVL01044821.1:2903-3244(-)
MDIPQFLVTMKNLWNAAEGHGENSIYSAKVRYIVIIQPIKKRSANCPEFDSATLSPAYTVTAHGTSKNHHGAIRRIQCSEDATSSVDRKGGDIEDIVCMRGKWSEHTIECRGW